MTSVHAGGQVHDENISAMEQLFLAPGFSQTWIGLARDRQWIQKQTLMEPITQHLFAALRPCVVAMHWPNVTIFLLNGPGSTIGIRTFCAFVCTLLVFEKIDASQIYVCDTLHFAQLVLRARGVQRPVCARVQMSKMLALNALGDTLHSASEVEQMQGIWLEHPCLASTVPLFSFTWDEVLPLLQTESPWQTTGAPDVFQP